MHDHAITLATPADLPRLLQVWDSSVRATHDFLYGEEIDALRPQVSDTLASCAPIHVLRDVAGRVRAFIGVADGEIAMLFVHANHRRCGDGRRLIQFAMEALDAHRVDVNEHNAQGLAFYRAMGFRAVARSPRDRQGRPFPLLHLLLDNHAARARQAVA